MTEELKRLEKCDSYLGLAEFAYVLGITKQALTNRRARHPREFPEPVQLAMGPVWGYDAIRYWLVYLRK